MNKLLLVLAMLCASCSDSPEDTAQSNSGSSLPVTSFTEKEYKEALHYCTHDEEKHIYVRPFEASVCTEHYNDIMNKGLMLDRKKSVELTNARKNYHAEFNQTMRDLSNGLRWCSTELINEVYTVLVMRTGVDEIKNRLERKSAENVHCRAPTKFNVFFDITSRYIKNVLDRHSEPTEFKIHNRMMGAHYTNVGKEYQDLWCLDLTRKMNDFNLFVLENSDLEDSSINKIKDEIESLLNSLTDDYKNCGVLDKHDKTKAANLEDIKWFLGGAWSFDFDTLCRADIRKEFSPIISFNPHTFSHDSSVGVKLRDYPNQECVNASIVDVINNPNGDYQIIKILE
jgi:division protein CdvB (Snf7/Vps24/ESCRT-III family)